MIVGPFGVPLIFFRGEGNKERIDAFVKETIKFYFEELDWEPIPRLLEQDAEVNIRHNK